MIVRSAAARWRGATKCRAHSWTSSASTGSVPVAAALEPAKEPFISPKAFAECYLRASRPGLFPSLIRGDKGSPYVWPACSEWSTSGGLLSGMRKIEDLQDVLVEVEISPPGQGYGEAITAQSHGDDGDGGSSWSKVSMPFGLFLEAFIEGKIPWQNSDAGAAPRMVGYVAQQDLFEKSNELVRQCPPLPHTTAGMRGDREQWRRNVWIGGADSFTPIHCDPYENFYTQVVGSKRVHIFPPSVSASLYLFASSTAQGNTSSIPREDYLLSDHKEITKSTYPLLKAALAHPDTRQTTLQAGDALYIPKGWFHCFRSISISASVNSWFR